MEKLMNGSQNGYSELSMRVIYFMTLVPAHPHFH